MAKTYSFSDVTLTLSHPSLGQISTNGMGLGNIQVSMRTDRSSIDVSADGTPVVSKIKDRTGQLQIQVQQTSDLNSNLKRWYNYLEFAETAEWAKIKGVITSRQTGEQHVMTGGSFTKIPDISYESNSGNVTWQLLFADVTQNVI